MEQQHCVTLQRPIASCAEHPKRRLGRINEQFSYFWLLCSPKGSLLRRDKLVWLKCEQGWPLSHWINFLRLRGLALILLVIKLGNYQKQNSETLLEIQFMTFLTSSHEIFSPELFGYVLSIAHQTYTVSWSHYCNTKVLSLNMVKFAAFSTTEKAWRYRSIACLNDFAQSMH